MGLENFKGEQLADILLSIHANEPVSVLHGILKLCTFIRENNNEEIDVASILHKFKKEGYEPIQNKDDLQYKGCKGDEIWTLARSDAGAFAYMTARNFITSLNRDMTFYKNRLLHLDEEGIREWIAEHQN